MKRWVLPSMGLRTTVLSLILLALLRIKRPENLKEYSPEQLGAFVGTGPHGRSENLADASSRSWPSGAKDAS